MDIDDVTSIYSALAVALASVAFALTIIMPMLHGLFGRRR